MLAGAFDLFRVGIGPSSSHTIGPMLAAAEVARRLDGEELASLRITLYGSLALTGAGHGTHRALIAGLAGERPGSVDPVEVLALDPAARPVRVGRHELARFELRTRIRGAAPGHPNAMAFLAHGPDGQLLLETTFRSIGGGFLTEDGVPSPERAAPPLDYATAAELVVLAERHGGMAAVAARNAAAGRTPAEVEAELLTLEQAMQASIESGLHGEGELPGSLRVRRRAPALHAQLAAGADGPLAALEWVGLWAMAVNEENACGGRVVTAPTNGAAGVLPAVLRYARRFQDVGDQGAVELLLAAAAVGALIKRNASISGAEVGCQGEVGSAAAMAAAGLAEVLGGTPAQVANAAEIALEHHLGMTCDPIAGLVQVPCIERNAIGAGKAIAAAQLALRGDGRHVVSLDQVIDAMRRTGADMRSAYKETSRGGLAVSVPEC